MIVVVFLMPFFALLVRFPLGGYYQRANAGGIRFSNALIALGELGIFEKLFEHFSGDRNLKYLLIDSTIVRLQEGTAGARKTRW